MKFLCLPNVEWFDSLDHNKITFFLCSERFFCDRAGLRSGDEMPSVQPEMERSCYRSTNLKGNPAKFALKPVNFQSCKSVPEPFYVPFSTTPGPPRHENHSFQRFHSSAFAALMLFARYALANIRWLEKSGIFVFASEVFSTLRHVRGQLSSEHQKRKIKIWKFWKR